MPTLADLLLVGRQRDALVADCVKLIEKQIDNHPPVRRLALKAGMSVLNSIRPDGLNWAVDRMLPDFVTALEPLYQRFRQSNDQDFSLFLRKHSEDAVEAIVGSADRRAQRVQNPVLRGGYSRVRPMAKAEVRDALPGLSKLISGYMG